MTRLPAAVLAVALVLAAACGDDDPEVVPSSATSTSTTTPPTTDGERPCDPSRTTPAAASLTLDVDPPDVRSGVPVTWRLGVRNGGDAPVELVFRSGQSGDVVLLGDAGEAYRWSADMAFTEAIRCETLDAGEERVYELEGGPVAVPPGMYRYEATLTANPAPPPVTGTIEVTD